MAYNKRRLKFIQIFIALVILLQGFTVGAEYNYLDQDELPINRNILDKPQYIEGEYVIKYKGLVSQYEKFNLYDMENINLVESFDETNTDLVMIRQGPKQDNIIQRLKRNPKIELIEPNYLYYPMEIATSEPRFDELWGLKNTGQSIKGMSGKPDIDIDILDAWEFTKGDSDVVVAIIDTGIDTAHLDLRDNIWRNNEETLNGQDSDGNGYIDDIFGWDFLNDDNSVYDYEDGDSHGTHIAGILAGSINGIGITGVAPNIKIMPLKFLGTDKFGDTVGKLSDVLKAIDYAKNQGVKIVNASWGNYEHSQLLEEAIADSGMLFLAASGNETINTDITPSYPANFNLPNIISIGAVNNRGEFADFSNYGETTVHVAAPGEHILSIVPLNRYQSAAVYNEGTNYKSLFQAFGLEIFTQIEDRIDLMSRSLMTLEIDKEDSILLVQDDESSKVGYKNCLTYYEMPLEELGFINIDTYIVKQHENGPSFDKMKDYDLVLWFTGEGFGSLNGSIKTITNDDQENLIQYLENGGKFYLSGRDAGEKIENTSFYKDYLGVEFKSQIGEPVRDEEKWKNVIIGKEGTSFEQGSFITNNTIYADIISPLNNAKIAMVYGNSRTYLDSNMYSSGTSMATPYVSGIAALLYSLGEEDILSIKSLIMRGVNSIDGIEYKLLTGGMVNATNSMNMYLNGETDYVTGIELDARSIELDTMLNNGYSLIPSITPLYAHDKRVRWISSDENIAVVDEYGRVEAVGKGEATITAITLDGGYISRCNIVVKDSYYPIVVKDIILDNQNVAVNLDMVSNHIIGTVIVQAYDGNNRPMKLMYSDMGILEDSYIFDFGETTKPIQYIKVFVWDSFDNMRPLAMAWENK